MAQRSPANVLAAYEMLLEELESEIDWLNEAGARAFATGQHATAQELLARVQKLTSLRSDLIAWARNVRPLVDSPAPDLKRRRLQHHKKTPEEAYRLPILHTLVSMGGSGQVAAVLDRVYETMKDQLNEFDLALLPSGHMVRWRNTAQWCRNSMREEGLIKGDSPHGLWEISEKGRKWLAAQR